MSDTVLEKFLDTITSNAFLDKQKSLLKAVPAPSTLQSNVENCVFGCVFMNHTLLQHYMFLYLHAIR